jgi:hypothetical protein
MFDLIFALDQKFNLGVDLYHGIWHHLSLMGDMYIDIIEKFDDHILLSNLLQNKNHTEMIYKEQLYEIIFEMKNKLVGDKFNGKFSVP